MTEVILYAGFDEIKCDQFRKSNLSNGKAMLPHIFHVKEHRKTTGTTIFGRCVKQMKVTGKDSFYDIDFQLDSNRNVIDMHCSCVPGISGLCKHSAALFLYINCERQETQTDQPCGWNKPSEKGKELYPKGKCLDDLIKSEKVPPPRQATKEEMEQHLTLLAKNNLQDSMIFKAFTSNVSLPEAEVEPSEDVIPESLRLQMFQARRGCHFMVSVLNGTGGVILKKLEQTLDGVSKSFYEERVKMTLEEARHLCQKTVGQSKNHLWFQARKFRITASKAHTVLKSRTKDTRVKNWARSLPDLPSLKYGRETEPLARSSYENLNSCNVIQIGLLLQPFQSWLAGSCDGVSKHGEEWILLEIKCPSSCRSKKIDVPYVKNEKLKKNHIYYTQIQILLYLTNLKKCHFFLFSSTDSKQIEVQRDEDFI